MSMDQPDQPLWSHRQAIVNDVRLHYVEAGAGPLVILLHGFPECWYSWRHQIPALAAAGYHVIAPDMRGYNRSEKPIGVRPYRLEALTADVAALIRHAGADRAAVVGHDWGGLVAWQLPVHHPEVVERLIVLNAPHPGAMLRELRRPRQLRRSWYILFFQLPCLPEALARAGNYALFRRLLARGAVHPGAFSGRDLDRYVHALAQPGAATCMVNYYRALVRRPPADLLRMARRVDVPTLLIWGERDVALDIHLTEGLERWVPNLRLERIADASHWVQNDVPDRVNALLLDFLRAP
jgi:pimeloyl-ACP methyl ester carboxylesterase